MVPPGVAISLLTTFLTIIFSFYGLRYSFKMVDQERQKYFEAKFMAQHDEFYRTHGGNFSNVFIQVNFIEDRNYDNWRSLCNEYQKTTSLWNYLSSALVYHPVEISIENIAFRRLPLIPEPVRIEIIRCSEKYALTLSRKGSSRYIYLLEKSEYDDSTTDEIFYIMVRIKETAPTQMGSPDEGQTSRSGPEINDVDLRTTKSKDN